MKHLVKINSKFKLDGLTDIGKIDFDSFCDFSYYRIVNPLTKQVFSYEENKLKLIDSYRCYDLWGTGKSCDYCVSTDALTSNSTKNKLEQIDGELFLAKVLPISIDNNEYVLELFQNIGDSYVKTTSEHVRLSSIINQLNQLAAIDSFSGLFSHGFMVNKLYEITNDNILPVSLLCLDIDNMKYVNDTFGHYEGDILIKNVSNELIKLNGNNIFAGRTGGDEFQIIFINFDKKSALEHSSQVLKNIEKILIKNQYHATTSWAIEERENNQSEKEFMEIVDQKMYEIKKSHHK